jgi:hypothetical protein
MISDSNDWIIGWTVETSRANSAEPLLAFEHVDAQQNLSPGIFAHKMTFKFQMSFLHVRLGGALCSEPPSKNIVPRQIL